MMISPDTFIVGYKDKPYLELMKERDSLMESVRWFEQAEIAGDRSDPAWRYCPSPDVQYQVNLEYLSALCQLMQERYNRDYVFGEHRLKDETEKLD